MKLKTMIKQLDDGFDIGDNIWDFGNYFGYTLGSDDYYDKVLDFMASKIDLLKYQPNWYSICDITGFIVKYQDKFDEFLNEVYREEYTPAHICKKYGIEKIKADDELFYDVYIEGLFGGLINGSFSEDNYKRLYAILKEKKL